MVLNFKNTLNALIDLNYFLAFNNNLALNL